jgi:hypothetical protein
MLRMHFFIGPCAMGLVAKSVAAQDDAVKLLLLRETAEPIACGTMRYIKGNLYGVPRNVNLDGVLSAIGLCVRVVTCGHIVSKRAYGEGISTSNLDN